MPQYSQILSDEIILNMVKPYYKKVLLLGCGGCMNESLAFLHSCPLVVHGKKDTFPALESELNRLVELLNNNGLSAKTLILPPESNLNCIRNIHGERFSLPKALPIDVILVLSCPAGQGGLLRTLKNIPMINITKLTGELYYKFLDDGKKRIIVNGKVWPLSAEL